ncbi:hypothetical protein [Chroococcus sp. FPU101]|uniref:hypothetical protein n=1 Tax=Chroococcus sp. FPU101 TaxID=1974212 RepID=UPI001A8F962A|nr:hypothetical protein [Chroococcus sp. FPU101]GFE68013.1 hypothetical protein CFPU101_06230 [Chroococcus sp. FPU101]
MFRQFSFLSLIALIFPLPSYADVRIVQSSNQTVSVSGSNNQVYQVINQTIIYRPKKRQNERDWKPKKDKIREDQRDHRERREQDNDD